MKIAWATDVHLSFAPPDEFKAFLRGVQNSGAKALMVTGDIGESYNCVEFVRLMRAHAGIPVIFVLGNHDFYGSSIAAVRERVQAAHDPGAGIVWASAAGVYELTSKVAVVGHEGWADGRYADWFQSDVDLNDYHHIEGLKRGPAKRAGYNGMTSPRYIPGPGWTAVLERMQALADESATHARKYLREALAQYESVIFLSHYPPFAENAVYRGKVSNANWMPHFSCKALGDALLEVADEHPERSILGLCGHSHGSADVRPRPNLRVLTGQAEYREPRLAGTFDLALPLLKSGSY